MSRIDIERVGGLAGFGSPGAHVRSRGQIASADLTPADRRAVDALFAHPPRGAHAPDAFRYRLTRQGTGGPETIEVGEEHVPEAVKAVVKDELV